jgi:hypothetical protein
VEKRCRGGQATDVNMAHAHCMLDTKVTNTHSEYVIIIALPLQQLLHKRESMLRHTYTACLVIFFLIFCVLAIYIVYSSFTL